MLLEFRQRERPIYAMSSSPDMNEQRCTFLGREGEKAGTTARHFSHLYQSMRGREDDAPYEVICSFLKFLLALQFVALILEYFPPAGLPTAVLSGSQH